MSRYSQLYIDQSAPLPDSSRARHRLGKLMQSLLTDTDAYRLSEFLERELGVVVGAFRAHHMLDFCATCSIRDLLDTVTITFTNLKGQGVSATIWLNETRRIFSEERLAYEIDDGGIVHPAVDKEFQRNRQATVAGLQMPRYANSLAAFERISDELASQPPNGKEAWRAVFTAVEGLFKLMFPSAPQLNAAAGFRSSIKPMQSRNEPRTSRWQHLRIGWTPHTTTDMRLAAKNQFSRRLTWRFWRSAMVPHFCGG